LRSGWFSYIVVGEDCNKLIPVGLYSSGIIGEGRRQTGPCQRRLYNRLLRFSLRFDLGFGLGFRLGFDLGRGPRRARPSPPPSARLARLAPIRSVVLRAARKRVRRQTRGLYPAPPAILDCVETGWDAGDCHDCAANEQPDCNDVCVASIHHMDGTGRGQ